MPKICEFQNCRKRALYGLKYGIPLRCKEHRENLYYQYDRCVCGSAYPSFNFPGQSKKYCKKCKTEEMIDISYPKCKTCLIKQPIFNIPGQTKGLFCKNCRTEEMIDVVSHKCVECLAVRPNFNIPGENAKYCSSCKHDGMVNVTSPKCIGCLEKRPNFNLPGMKPSYCSSCKTEDMCDVNHKICKGQDGLCTTNGNKKYKGYCTFCFSHMFPNDPLTFQIQSKTKEIAVRDFINANYKGFYHDKTLITGHCDCTVRRRVDHRKVINGTLLAIETDENQHRSYVTMDEETRYNDLYMGFSGKWVYIRFNPDKYIDEEGKKRNPAIATRLRVLGTEIDTQIKRIKRGLNSELVERIYLYYDGYN